ncbi:GNAT family N-acetyltransferase [Rugosimonospora acidiphila]|uniref:GNAT family N-acetyltransferase n=1 Tax=Rugosimonospora acidiphila TaxID=556531 RepID=A0ABP9SRL0_9ACTN
MRASTLQVVPVEWHHPDAASLRDAMVAEIEHRYADRISDPRQRSPQTSVESATVAYTALAYLDQTPVGHVALRHHFGDIELKRMYVAPAARGTGVGAALLSAAESAARAAGATRILLHTGDRQPEAVRLYQRHGYRPVPLFPPYDTIPGSLCFAKPLGDNAEPRMGHVRADLDPDDYR